MAIIHNVRDGRVGAIGSWEVEPLVYGELSPKHIGRTIIYQNHGRAEAGTITSWRDGIVFARYSAGDTSAGADPPHLWLALHPDRDKTLEQNRPSPSLPRAASVP